MVLGLALASGSCALLGKGTNQGPNSYPLIVRNHSDFEIVIYALPSVEGAGIRIGNARPLATMTMTVPRNVLQPSDVLMLNLHAIGSGRLVPSWTTPGYQLDTNLVAQLDLRSDPAGNLNRSTLIVDYPLTRPPGGPEFERW